MVCDGVWVGSRGGVGGIVLVLILTVFDPFFLTPGPALALLLLSLTAPILFCLKCVIVPVPDLGCLLRNGQLGRR